MRGNTSGRRALDRGFSEHSTLVKLYDRHALDNGFTQYGVSHRVGQGLRMEIYRGTNLG